MKFDYVTAHDEVVFIPVIRRRRTSDELDQVVIDRLVQQFFRPLQ